MRICALLLSLVLLVLTLNDISVVTGAFPDLLERNSKYHTHTSVLESPCSAPLYL